MSGASMADRSNGCRVRSGEKRGERRARSGGARGRAAWAGVAALVFGLAGIVVVGTGGCASDPREGYSTASTFAAEVKSVSVPLFENGTYTHGLEVELADAIVKEIQRSTGWRVVGEGGDTALSGSITSTDMKLLSSGRTSGLAEDLLVRITVDFSWKNNRTGKVLVARRGFTAAEPFSPAQGVEERIEVGQYSAVQALARDIVAEMRSTW